MKTIRTGLVMLLLMVGVRLFGQIQITEVAYEEWYRTDTDGDYGAGWVEIKNISDKIVNTTGFDLHLNNLEPWQLPGTSLNPGGYWMIWLSGKDRKTDVADLHASFSIEGKLNILKIVDRASSTTIDSLLISTRPYWNESKARYPENGDHWFNVTTTTPGATNVAFGSWRRISTLSDFFPRDSAPNASLYFDNKFWIMEGWPGGGGEEVAIAAVWTSTNARDWKMVCEFPPYNPYSGYVVFNGYIWAFDGSAYRSSDGITWTKVAENLPFTTNNRVVVFNNELIAVKGSAVYRSPDGINWIEQTPTAPWGYREFPALVSFHGKVWIFGGGINYFSGQDHYFTDVWSSVDGVQWKQEVYETEWRGRLWFGYTVFDDKIWLMGGWNYYDKENDLYGNRNDVWFTSNGTKWEKLNSASTWPPRHAPLVWATDENLYISCGYLNTFGLFNDIWTMDKLNAGSVNGFYLQHDQDPKALASWGTREDGTGFKPAGFDFDKQYFHMSGGDSIVLANNWGVSGLNTRLVIGDGIDSVDVELKPGIDITGDVELKAKTTLHVSGNTRTPHILVADAQSRIIVRDGDSELNAASVGHLDIVDASIDLSEPCLVTSSLSISGDVAIEGESFHYRPGTLLTYSTSNHIVGRSEWPHEDYPASVTINEEGKLMVSNNARADTLIFSSGKLQIDSASLFVNQIEGISDTTYVITGREGYLKMPVAQSSRLFPVGTDTTYAPIDIKLPGLGAGSEQIMVVRTTALDTLRHDAFAVKTGWFIAEAAADPRVGFVLDPKGDYTIRAHWPKSDQGSGADENLLTFKHLEQGVWVAQSSTEFSPDPATGRRSLVSSVSDYGWFIVQDSRTSMPTTVTFYPNPASEYIEIGFKEPPEESVLMNMFNVSGQQALEIEFEPGYNFYRIPLDHRLGDGLYILNVYTDGSYHSERILIQNQNSP